MWLWVLLFVAIAVLGLVVTGALAWRLYGKARRLGHAVAEAGARVTEASVALERASGQLEDRPAPRP